MKTHTTKRKTAKRGRPRSEDVSRRSQHLFDTTVAVLLRDGYAGTSIAKIAREGGLSKKTIYAKYRDKEELAEAVLNHLLENMWEHLTLCAEGESRSLASILMDFALTLGHHVCCPLGIGFYRILISESPSSKELSELHRRVRERWETPLRNIFRTFIQKGELRVVDPGILSRLFYQLAVTDLRERAVLGRGKIREKEIKDAAALTVETLLAAYAVNKPA